MNAYLKWSLIVGLNTIFSIAIVFDHLTTVSGALGIVVGIISFIILYVKLDNYLKRTNKKEWRKSLLIATIMMGLFSLYPVIPIVSGAIALDTTSWLLSSPSPSSLTSFGIKDSGFFSILITTLLSGMILSCVATILMVITRALLYLSNRHTYRNCHR